MEFWGTNRKDKSGLALHLSFIEKGIVDVPYIKYHEENETAHDISREAFETYILNLYAQLDDNYQIDNGTASIEITQTTTEKVTTTPMATSPDFAPVTSTLTSES